MIQRKYYKLIECKNLPDFNEKVTSYLSAGWELHGSPFVLVIPNVLADQYYCQAIVKVGEESSL